MRQAVRNILEHQVKANSCMALLLFGWPGSAKSSIIPNVVAELRSDGQPWHYVRVSCHRLLLCSLDQVRADFAEIDRMLPNQSDPMVMVLDELDAISPYRMGGFVLNPLTGMSMTVFQQRESYRQKVLCGVTNNPRLIDSAVRDHCEIPLYFELPDDRMMVEILKREGPMDAALASQVVDCLQSRARSARARYSGRAIANGCRKVKGLLEDPGFKGRNPAEIAEDIASYADQISQQEIDSWEGENANFLSRARQQLRFWAARKV